MKTHVFGTQTFAIFARSEGGGVWMLHFIWGKKDFRVYLGRSSGPGTAPGTGPALLQTAQGEALNVRRLQYLYNFEWYDFVKVADHGLASERLLFRREGQSRNVELPKDFYDIAVELACLEFNLQRTDRTRRLAS
ncbi:MAG TPA: hypothetical protein VL359_14290 [bacterium]|nr:hypothetical protein [bacterium]